MSHAYVEFTTEVTPETVAEALSDDWIGSSKLRFATSRDDDNFNHRTVVIGNLPNDMTLNDRYSVDVMDLVRDIGSVV